jgi:hypothetical protein
MSKNLSSQIVATLNTEKTMSEVSRLFRLMNNIILKNLFAYFVLSTHLLKKLNTHENDAE